MKDFKATAEYVIAVAGKYAAHNASAMLRLNDALKLYGEGKYEYARMAGLDSLRHSVGIFHNDFKAANAK